MLVEDTRFLFGLKMWIISCWFNKQKFYFPRERNAKDGKLGRSGASYFPVEFYHQDVLELLPALEDCHMVNFFDLTPLE